MTATDVIKLAGAIMGSLGGAGAIIFGLSGFLGKLWADRALEDHRHKYAQLNQQMQHDLDRASKRLQMELDNLGLVHSLRTKEEFPLLSALWKKFSVLHVAFRSVFNPNKSALYPDANERRQHSDKLSKNFVEALQQARQFVYEEAIFIPQPIAKAAEDLLWYPDALLDSVDAGYRRDREELREVIDDAIRQFDAGRSHLEKLIRKHIKSEPIEVISD
jgi:hypothetical protein